MGICFSGKRNRAFLNNARAALLMLIIGFPFQIKAQPISPYEKLKYDKVVIYDYLPKGEKGGTIINSDGKLVSNILKEMTLAPAAAQKLSQKLGNKTSFGGVTAFCFEPHLGIVYYAKGKILAHISICFSCNRLKSSIDLATQKQGRVGEGTDSYYIADGMSKSFRAYLNSLARKGGFSNQIVAGSDFDR